ncbi:hypothetical protein J2W23_004841 [Variovorax boronicumulans]|uniref:hypothetical protein n=1 Tax=Variovorax boronicumulans TaxID=436515 RepID=UPI002787505C|nr:hypothetical protein [Variovorax boronicumulans]MDQ0016438.1 hypothetical protein [Variovorax boronicumulans]
MTVLIHFEELRVAVSDVLMSVAVKGGGIWLPSIGLPHVANPDLPIRPTSLVRKFFRVQRPGSAGMFLVCGTRSHIQEVVDNVEGLISGTRRPPAALAHQLFPDNVASLVDVASKMAEDHEKAEFELLGRVDGADYSRHLRQTIPRRLPYWGSVVAMGSGARDALEWLDAKGRSYEAHGLMDDDADMKCLRALNAVPSLLLEEDTRAMRTVKEGVGGYYESFAIGHDTLRPSDNVLTIFGRFKAGGTGPLFELRRVFFHIYDVDTLVIGSVTELPRDISVGQPLRVPLEDLAVTHVGPFGDAPAMTWNSSRLAIKMNSPEAMRLTTYRGPNDRAVQRFYEGLGERRLLNFKVAGGFLHVQLNPEAFTHYLGRSDIKTPLA